MHHVLRHPRGSSVAKAAVAVLAGALAIAMVTVAGAAPDAISITPTVNPLNGVQLETTFNAVTCTSSSSCVAVGGITGDDGLGEPITATGTEASLVSAKVRSFALAAAFAGGDLEAVTCTSSTSCVAVGYTDNLQPITLSGNPATWTASDVKVLATSKTGTLSAVSCTSSTSCVAVGELDSQPLVLQGDPATWTTSDESTVALGGDFGDGGYLNTITCTSSTACVAMGGDDDYQPLQLAGDPSSWTASNATELTESAPFIFGEFTSIVCSSATACTAVGYTYVDTSYDFEPLVLVGNPASWTAGDITELALPSSLKSTGQLARLSCVSPTACTAVGFNEDGTPFALEGDPSSWVGTDATVVSVGSALGGGATLSGVECLTTVTTCVAVGSDDAGRAIVAHGDGATFSLSELSLTSPTGGSLTAKVHGMSCPTPTDCVAVGVDANGLPVAISSSVSGWRTGKAMVPAHATGGTLEDVSCAATTSCVAVGGFESDPMLLRGNPATWGAKSATLLTLSSAYDGYGDLEGVSCTSPTFCVAVGQGGASDPLIVTGNPAAWSAHSPKLLKLSSALGAYGSFDAVTCTSTTRCVVVGADGKGDPISIAGNPATFTAAKVRQLSLHAPDDEDAVLESVACPTTTECVAVGHADGTKRALVAVGNPATWTGAAAFTVTVPAEAPSTVEGFSETGDATAVAFQGVACQSVTSCTAVGDDGDGAPFALVGTPTSWHGTVAVRLKRAGAYTTGSVDAAACTQAGCEVSGSTTGGMLLAKL